MSRRKSLIISSIILTIIIIYFNQQSSINTENISKKKRILILTNNSLSDVCGNFNSSTLFGDAYYNAINDLNYSLVNYTLLTQTSINGNQSVIDLTNIIFNILKDKFDSNQVVNYAVTRFGGVLGIIIFSVLTLLIFVFCCTSCCCPCDCCVRTSDKSHIVGLITLIIAALASLAIVVMACLGFYYFKNFASAGITGQCAVLKIYNDFINGPNSTTIPHWTGVQSTQNMVNGIQTALQSLSSGYRAVFSNTAFLQGDPIRFNNFLDQTYQTFQKSTLPNPNPVTAATTPNINPIYVKNYGDKNTDKSVLNLINQEYQMRIQNSINIINTLQSSNQYVSDNLNNINSQFKSINGILNNLNNSINSISDTMIDPVNSIFNYINNSISGIALACLIIFFLCSLANFICLLIMIFCKCGFGGYVSQVAWFLTVLFMILGFIVGPLIYSLGLFSFDISNSLYYLLNTNMLVNGTLTKNDINSGQMLDICINQNGSIANTYLQNSQTNNLDDLYQSSANLSKISSIISANNFSYVINETKKIYNFYSNNFISLADSSLGINSIDQVMKSWSSWLDSNNNGEMSKCISPFPAMDFFTDNLTSCPIGYIVYDSPGLNPNIGIGQKCCLNISNWNQAISPRYSPYSSCGGPKDNFNNVFTANVAYGNQIIQFITQNKALLKRMIGDLETMNSYFSDTSKNLNSLIQNLQQLTSPLTNLLNSTTGSGKISSMMNCKFVGVNVNNLLIILSGNMQNYALLLGQNLIIICFLGIMMTFFSIICFNYINYLPPGRNSEYEMVKVE